MRAARLTTAVKRRTPSAKPGSSVLLGSSGIEGSVLLMKRTNSSRNSNGCKVRKEPPCSLAGIAAGAARAFADQGENRAAHRHCMAGQITKLNDGAEQR